MITLASDFGSPYPAAMRGVIARRSDARLVDVAHDFPRQDVRAAAFWLRFVLPEFPPAIHLAVVDPGVGTGRDALVVRAGDHALVGPDNGLLLPAARRLAGETPVEAFVADPGDPASSTFHGRDVFAPLAADVHEAGVADAAALDRLRPAGDVTDLRLPEPTVTVDEARGEVLAVDGFGNAITNLPGDAVAGRDRVRVNGTPAPVVDTFDAVAPGDRLVTVGSHGNVECDVNRGRGDDAFDLSTGDPVVLEF
ncbi:MAG: S-adenosyl-l-methionine hydroxide adenosyltransferase family protein [Haloferacaceae archaeon]